MFSFSLILMRVQCTETSTSITVYSITIKRSIVNTKSCLGFCAIPHMLYSCRAGTLPLVQCELNKNPVANWWIPLSNDVARTEENATFQHKVCTRPPFYRSSLSFPVGVSNIYCPQWIDMVNLIISCSLYSTEFGSYILLEFWALWHNKRIKDKQFDKSCIWSFHIFWLQHTHFLW